MGLAKSRASVGATLAYWLGNPILNPATMVFMGFVLGWGWVGLRIVVGVIMVFGVAYVAQRFVPESAVPAEAAAAREAALTPPTESGSMIGRWLKALWQLCIGLLPEYAVILLVLGAVRAWLFPAMSPAIGQSVLLMLGLAVGGMLFVIPTAGEVPIVQTLMGFGLGAGGAAALLTTLPPVSLPSLFMVGRAVPVRVLVFVACSVVVLGWLSGFAALALGM